MARKPHCRRHDAAGRGIEDKPGANGAIAAAYVARATADGYTLLLSTDSPHSAAPSLNKSVPYDP